MQPSNLSMKGAVHNKGELAVPDIALCAISSNTRESEVAINAANETLSLVNLHYFYLICKPPLYF